MKLQKLMARAALLLGLSLATSAIAGNHADYVGAGPFKTGPEVTKKCMECHEAETKSFMKSVHWTWAKKQKINGKEMEYGKKNALNNFCVAIDSNWPRCTSCHAGYGWKDKSFDFNKAENVDCLVCHETTGTYKKTPAGAGNPDSKVDLVKVAQSVGKPTRQACGSCHFYGGGGDRVKHGDLDSSLANPSAEIDVHMGGKAKMTCQSCHKGGKDHAIKGEAIAVSVGAGPRIMGCTDCHKENVHKNGFLNKHAKKVACQTCHIPTFAKAKATKVWWDWSTAGKNLKPEEIKHDQYGEHLYAKMKGDFKWDKDVVPTYEWYNGTVDRVLLGDKIDPSKVVKLSAAKGDRKDPNAKIMPFKIMRGKQPYDSVNNTVAVVNTFGPPTSETAYWVKYDWNKAIEAGMKAANQPYSGKYGFIETSMVWAVNHMVAPKDKALKCGDCHGDKGRLDWKALGYKGDPKNPANR
ncbi:octaheme c-type cytochrome, tetrathionate reductase family [Trichlorobacter thiogenes]|uniref:Octaheme c-type cytochrome, tetrathionate reductase family n=1 Tax=Trichlorobacter thiogenes TaxID=115783 RepID=A0A1T4N3G8_9BACT|nr:tetrathionate reductase family octaheme c-type cytochrome [Trichlorobacter thiogenes]SJZ73762.1 octaheme c-type cytochrome, tetrathionate reductase family [Trichlorobacter thiogenes]